VLITTNIPPTPIVVKTSGKLVKLLVKDNDNVDSMQILAIIENTANYKDILEVEKILSSNTILKNIEQIGYNKSLQMGEIQNDYSQFLNSIEEIKLYKGTNFKRFQISKLNENTNYQKALNNTYKNQLNNLLAELAAAQSKLSNDATLLNKGIISNREYQESQSHVNALNNQIEGLSANISSGNMSLISIQQQQKEIINTDNSTQLSKELALSENINNMKSKIQLWKSNYLLCSPCKGYISLGNVRNENQFVEAGKVIFSVLKEKTNYSAKMNLLTMNAGKVKIGQMVLVKLDNYPYQEYGTLEARITNISTVPVDSKYIVEAVLINNDTTSYHKKIDMQIDMQGQAEIITSKKRLISKFFDRLSYLWHNKLS
jgi:HlyD family secretion protein